MKRIICLILCLILTLGIFGCAKDLDAPESSTPENSESNNSEDYAQGKTVACCMGSITHPVHRVVQYGFCTKAEELGMIPIVSGLESGAMDELISQWETDISLNNAVGALIWTGDDSCYEMMKVLKQKGIYTVIPYYAHYYEYTNSFIDVNPYFSWREYGIAVADKLVEILVEKGIESGNIAVSQNGPSFVSNAANNGFRERINELGVSYKVLDTIMVGAEINEGTKKATELLNEKDNIVAAVGFDISDILYWESAAVNCSRSDLTLIGLGFYNDAIKLMEEERIDVLVVDPIYKTGTVSAQYLHELINGKVFKSEDEWFTPLDIKLTYPGGEGENNIQTYRDIYDAAQEYFK